MDGFYKVDTPVMKELIFYDFFPKDSNEEVSSSSV